MAMQLFVGLGNPGDKYAHNIGFMAIDAIARRHSFPAFRQKFSGLLAEGSIDGERVLLLKPQTFMNTSGDSVVAAATFYKLGPADVSVFYDEIDLVPGKVRLKRGGGSGGHNGIRSIDPQLGTDYRRVRLGVGHPGHKLDQQWLVPLLEAVGDNAGLLLKGDDNTFMNKMALAIGGDAAARPERPETADPTRPKAQSHIRAARPQPPTAKAPESGPMANMLKKLFGTEKPDEPEKPDR
jgi:PTH1 family peptidyl-tRNA hydrolase